MPTKLALPQMLERKQSAKVTHRLNADRCTLLMIGNTSTTGFAVLHNTGDTLHRSSIGYTTVFDLYNVPLRNVWFRPRPRCLAGKFRYFH
jgi:hypothetical protein